jgi:hypothetical protein
MRGTPEVKAYSNFAANGAVTNLDTVFPNKPIVGWKVTVMPNPVSVPSIFLGIEFRFLVEAAGVEVGIANFTISQRQTPHAWSKIVFFNASADHAFEYKDVEFEQQFGVYPWLIKEAIVTGVTYELPLFMQLADNKKQGRQATFRSIRLSGDLDFSQVIIRQTVWILE